MALENSTRISPVNPMADLDERKGPHPNIQAALDATRYTREEGLTVMINDGSGVKEYWFKDDITDEDLVIKIPTDLKSDSNYIHDQYTPEDVWEINHNLNKFPTIQIVDSSNKIVEGYIEHENENKSIAMFNGKFSGKAICN